MNSARNSFSFGFKAGILSEMFDLSIVYTREVLTLRPILLKLSKILKVLMVRNLAIIAAPKLGV